MLVLLTGCLPGTTPSPSPSVGPVSNPSSASAGGAATAATQLVRAGATAPTPVGSAPITAEGPLKGGTLHVFSVRSTDRSTRLEYVFTHPTLSGLPQQLGDGTRNAELPVLRADGKTYRMTQFNMYGVSATGGQSWQPVTGNQYRMISEPRPMFGSFAPLPAGVSEVEVVSALTSEPIKVKVDRGAEPVPQGTTQVPIIGRVVYGDTSKPENAGPLIVTLHSLRRLENATVLYYSAVFPEGVAPKEFARWGGGSNVLNQTRSTGDDFAYSFGLVDRGAMTAYGQFGETNLKNACNGLYFSLRLKENAKLCYAIFPAVPKDATFDVIVGGQMLVQDVRIDGEGVLTPTVETPFDDVPELGAGWPVIPPAKLALASDKSFAQATVPLREVVTEGAITTSGEQLDLDTTVLFDYNQATLTPAAQGVLAKAAEQVRATGKKGEVKVTGHTDSDGSDAYNLDLSKRRAQAVADALRGLLGPGYTFAVEGKGESEPVADNATDAGKALNRRVTLLPPR